MPRLLTVAALLVSAIAVAVTVLALVPNHEVPVIYDHAGDYFNEADPALTSSSPFRFYAEDPAPLMTPFSLVVRWVGLRSAEQLGVEVADDATDRERVDHNYAIGAGLLAGLSFLLIAAPLGWRKRRIEILAGALFGAAAVLNPLAIRAIATGHPEELLMAVLIAAGLIAALRGSWRSTAVLIALAVATKQPALLVLPAFALACPAPQRGRAAIWFAATVAVAIVPWVVLDLAAFAGDNLDAGSVSAMVTTDQEYDLFSALHISAPASLERALLYLIALLGPALLAARNRASRWQLTATQLATLVPGLLVVRCLLDPANIDYYGVAAAIAFGVMGWYLWRPAASQHRRVLAGAACCLVTGGWLAAFSGGAGSYHGPVIQWVYENIGPDARHLVFVAAALPLAVAALALAAGWRPSAAGVAKAASASVLGIVVLVAALAVTADRQTTSSAEPGFGAAAASQPQFAATAAVWLGNDPPGSLRLRALGVVPRQARVAGGVVAVSDYGASLDRLAAISILTRARTPANESGQDLEQCLNGACPDDRMLADSGIGPAVVTFDGEGWMAVIAAGDNRLVTVIDAQSGYWPEQVLPHLQIASGGQPSRD